MEGLKQIPWCSALGLTSSGAPARFLPALAGPGWPQAPGCLLGHRVGVLGGLLDGVRVPHSLPFADDCARS